MEKTPFYLKYLLFAALVVSAPVAAAQDTAVGSLLTDDDEIIYLMRPVMPSDDRFTPQGQLARSLIGVRYRPRGEDNTRTRYDVNGAPLTDDADGRPYWNIITALSTMIRKPSDAPPLSVGARGLAPTGGSRSLLTAGTALPTQTRITGSLTNRSYLYRTTAASRYELPHGWALSAAANYRAGRDSYVQGVFTDLLSGAFTLSKSLGGSATAPRHTLALTGAGITGEQGVRGAATQEAYDLAGSNYYNPHWGMQGGTVRNSRVRGYGQWFGALTWAGEWNTRWEASATLSAFGGTNTYSLLAWYDAPTPQADYYRYMPSFFADPSVAASVADEWRAGNTSTTQIDWARLHEANSITPTADGTLRSHYVVRDLVTDKLNVALTGSAAFYPGRRSRPGNEKLRVNRRQAERGVEFYSNSPEARRRKSLRSGINNEKSNAAGAANSSFFINHSSFGFGSGKAGPETVLRAGFRVRADRADNFARLKDVLGGNWWLDIDQFLVDDEYYGDKLQNNVRDPDRRVRTGERFGYDYRITRRSAHLWAAAEYTGRRFELAAAVEAGRTDFLRTGRYEKEMFPGYRSYGRSARVAFTEWAAGATAAFWPALDHILTLRIAAEGRAPTVRGLFVSPNYRNETVAEALARAANVAQGNEELKMKNEKLNDGVGSTSHSTIYSSLVRTLAAEAVWRWHAAGRVAVEAVVWATHTRGGTDVRSFYDDVGREYTNMILSDVGSTRAGVEASVEVGITGQLTVLAAAAVSTFRYAGDPDVTLLRDSDGAVLLSGGRSLLDGLHTAAGPERAVVLTLGYRVRPSWRFEAGVRWVGAAWVAVDPARRMARALDAAGSPEARRAMTTQERLPDAVLPCVSVSRWFNLRGGRSAGLWLTADNLLDNRRIRTSGYEPMRLARASSSAGGTLRPMPSKYLYAHGANFYLMFTLAL